MRAYFSLLFFVFCCVTISYAQIPTDKISGVSIEKSRNVKKIIWEGTPVKVVLENKNGLKVKGYLKINSDSTLEVNGYIFKLEHLNKIKKRIPPQDYWNAAALTLFSPVVVGQGLGLLLLGPGSVPLLYASAAMGVLPPVAWMVIGICKMKGYKDKKFDFKIVSK